MVGAICPEGNRTEFYLEMAGMKELSWLEVHLRTVKAIKN